MSAALNKHTNSMLHPHATSNILPNQRRILSGGGFHLESSLKHFVCRLDSSESPPTESDGIYNAENLSTDEIRLQTAALDDIQISAVTASPTLQPLANRSPNLDVDLSGCTINAQSCRPRRTDTERSRSHMDEQSFIPRLQPSPERSPKIIKAQLSAHSIRPRHSNPLHKSLGMLKDPDHARSFSLNDLDCLPRSDTRKIILSRNKDVSSSSSQALKAVRLCPSFPHQPVRLPPYRSPTPPGLPSFRTREAQEYRLVASSPPNRAISLLHRLLGRNWSESDERNPVPCEPSTPPMSPRPHGTASSPPMAILRRVLGTSRLIESPPRQPLNPKASLPPGIQIASVPGALAQADDGTFVRGRWIPRASGHGIGLRGLDAHPLNRLNGFASIDEMVREIDKACEMANTENEDRQMSGTRSDVELSPENTIVSSPHSMNSPQQYFGSLNARIEPCASDHVSEADATTNDNECIEENWTPDERPVESPHVSYLKSMWQFCCRRDDSRASHSEDC